MNLKTTLCIAFLFALLSVPAFAQQDPADLGARDSIFVTMTQPSINGEHSTFTMEVWFFNDANNVASAGIGFTWDNPNLQMISATESPEALAAFNLGRWMYYKNNIDSTNSNQLFQFSGARIMGDGVIASPSPKLIATYEFALSDWSVLDTICIDSIVFSGGTVTSFVDAATNTEYKPYFAGLHCVGDPDAPQLGTLVVDPTELNFEAEVGGTSPQQSFLVSEAGEDAIVYDATATEPWVVLGNAQNVTPGTVTVDINTAGLAVGTYPAQINVTSGGAGNVATVNVNLVVAQGNLEPILDPIGNKSGDENTLIAFTVTASDPDATIPDILSSTLPMGATFVDNGNGTADFSWTPDFTQAGDYPITFTASDGDLTDEETITITVINVNRAPELTEIGDQMVDEKANLNFIVTASDLDNDALTLTTSALPGTATFVDNGDGTGTFDWTPSNTESGSYPVTFTVSDGEADVDEAITIVVTDIDGFQVMPGVLDFTAIVNTTNPPSKTFNVSVSDSSLIGFIVSEDATWFSATPATGITPTDVTVEVDITGLLVGSYTDTITIAPDLGTLTNLKALAPEELEPVFVVVNLNVVEPAKILAVNPTELFFEVYQGTSWLDGQTFDITEVGGTAIEYFLTPGAPWISVADTNGVTPGTATVNAVYSGLAPGAYLDSIEVVAPEAENPTLWVKVNLTVIECPTLTTEDATVFETQIFAGETATWNTSLSLTSSGPDELGWTAVDTDYFTFDASEGETPASVGLAYAHMFDTEGVYADTTVINGMSLDEGVDCASQITLIANVTVHRPPSADTVIVVNTPAVPGQHNVAVPVVFSNSCQLEGLSVSLQWQGPGILLDSVSFVGSAIEYVDDKAATIHEGMNVVNIMANVGTQSLVPIGSQQLWANLYFTLECEIEDGTYAITCDADTGIYFTRDCGEGSETDFPEYIQGNIIVGPASNFICGYVVDPDMNEIVGATVELWDNFPIDDVTMSTTSSGIGSFAFDGIMNVPFDVYAYMDGYYPGVVEDINFGEKGIIIVLHPIPDYPYVTPSQWVDYYCPSGENMYFGGLLPIGSVVEAFTQDGLLVGQKTVLERGKYGFMPVYRGNSDLDDNGAITDDVISFSINGLPAVASGNTVYPATNDEPMTVCLEVRGTTEKECTLVSGWNLVSWNVNTDTDAILDVLGPIMADIDVVLGFEQGGLTYDPELPEFSTLHRVDHLSGYWIRVKDEVAEVTLTTVGLPVPETTPIPVTAGWNLVSYLPEIDMAADLGLASIHDMLTVAYGFDIDNGIQIYRPDGGGFNTLTDLYPCNGYWVKVTDNGTLMYPGMVGGGEVFATSVASQTSKINSRDAGVVTTTNWINLYSSALTLDGKPVASGATITAHAADNDKLIGSFTLSTDGKFGFMPVYADGAEEVNGVVSGDEFYLMIDDVRSNETFTMAANGSRIEVGPLTAGKGANLPTEYSLVQNYPNPFNPSTTISFALPQAGNAKVEVFNVLGRLIATPFNGQAEAGETHVVWDGRDNSGDQAASGVYFYRLSADTYTETKKMMLLK